MLKIVSAEFMKGATASKQFPQTGIPEFAFFGRSNAGKSSLINMLLNRRNLVKTGSKPGMTREINFFMVNGHARTHSSSIERVLTRDASDRSESCKCLKAGIPVDNGMFQGLSTAQQPTGDSVLRKAGQRAFCVADLPGYGFAQVSFSERNRIDKMLYDYTTTRRELKTVFFLMDIRRDPTDVELQTRAFFQEHGIELVLTATKADKLSKTEQIKRVSALASFFDCPTDTIFLTSSSKKIGREKLLQHISAYLDA